MKDKLFIEIAEVLAKESKCVSLQVGAVLVKDNRIISIGYNGTVSGYNTCNESLQDGVFNREDHTKWSDSHEIHAEMNAILFAAKSGISTNGCTLYCTHEPCDQCLKNIIQAGVKRVVFKEPYKADRCRSQYRYLNLIELQQFNKESYGL